MAENRVAGERKTIIQIMNMRFWLTLLLGTLLIVLSHFVLDKKTPESASLVGTIFHEAGFALIVALVIWGMFEFFSQVEKDDIWNDRIEKIAKNVFFGVFRRNFPPDLIKEATELLLEQTFIRSGLHATYVLRDDKYRDSAGNDMSYVRLETVARFKIRNVTNMNAQYPIRIHPAPLEDDSSAQAKGAYNFHLNRYLLPHQGFVIWWKNIH